MSKLAISEKDRIFLQEGAGKAAALLKSIGNENRLLVLCLLIQTGEMSVGAMLEHIPLSQSALSQHLARLRDEGLVSTRKSSTAVFYRIADPAALKLIAVLAEIFCPPAC